MSRFDYEASKEIIMEDPPFYALIMAAMRKADSDNVILLANAFPEVWTELAKRYHGPGGLLDGET